MTKSGKNRVSHTLEGELIKVHMPFQYLRTLRISAQELEELV